MPMINITMGPSNETTKKEIIKRVTETLVEITDIPSEKFMTVIHEEPLENLGLGLKTLKELVAEK